VNRSTASVARACARISVDDLDVGQTDIAANATCPAARAYASSKGVRVAIDAARRRGVLDHASPGSAHAACVLTASFCDRFVRGAANIVTPSGERRPPVYAHGLSTTLAFAGGRMFSDIVPLVNPWLATLARAMNPRTRSALCRDVFPNERLQYHNTVDRVHCGFVDQTSLFYEPPPALILPAGVDSAVHTSNASSARRSECAGFDGWQNIHMYGELPQLMRVQLVLNSVRRAEEEAGSFD